MSAEFKKNIENSVLQVGSLISLQTAESAELLSQVGFDWLWIEMEHAPIDLSMAQSMIQSSTCPTVVRVPWNDSVWIKRVLDLGCDGIVVPQVKSATDARQAVAACMYPPLGIRSVGLARAQSFGLKFKEYVDSANDEITVILQIEHIDAVKCIDDILAVEGIDAIVVGPYDLSGSMNLTGQVSHPDVVAAIDKVFLSGKENEVPIGIFAGSPEAAEPYLENGCRLIALGTDAMYLWKSAQSSLQKVRSCNFPT